MIFLSSANFFPLWGFNGYEIRATMFLNFKGKSLTNGFWYSYTKYKRFVLESFAHHIWFEAKYMSNSRLYRRRGYMIQVHVIRMMWICFRCCISVSCSCLINRFPFEKKSPSNSIPIKHSASTTKIQNYWKKHHDWSNKLAHIKQKWKQRNKLLAVISTMSNMVWNFAASMNCMSEHYRASHIWYIDPSMYEMAYDMPSKRMNYNENERKSV